MTRLLWLLAWIGVAIWSLFAWAAYGLVDLFGGLAARHADTVTGHPDTVVWLSWTFGVLRDLGLGAIVVVWALGSLVMLAVPWAIDRFVGRPVVPTSSRGPLRRDGVLDLGPDQYRVDTPRGHSEPGRGSVPRVGRTP